ncbi:uncharacterized protein LOC121736174 [Aricia agestis]|uniref:uncharacterized protein LOC121736174 n=1 Tax=Aricia agestis TaxID=91739 RepID=UPI001C205ABC|nr:uncharacterized protein LOC121736174 [Aricia agestis]
MRLIFVAFLVPLCWANTITQEQLLSVFGPNSVALASPPQLRKPTPNASQDDYPDQDVYIPSQAEYDQFDWTLTKRIASTSNENFLISPLGLKLALAILMEAASGQTQEELSAVLGFERDTHLVRQKFAKILDSLQTKSSQYILEMGSRIFIGAGVEPRQRYAAIAQQFYKTEIVNMDFSDPVVSSKAINNWVANITHGRIPNLVDIDDVTGVVALVLNTLYFKGTWRHQFMPNETRPDQFFLTAKDKKLAQFMNVKDKFYYTESAKYNAKILRMPYLGQKFAMYIVVPNTHDGLPRIFTDLSGLRAELYFLQETIVDVTLPKFKFEYTSLLDSVLKELGIRVAFEDSASFPGIVRGQAARQPLKISKVVQRSGMEVNELGSIAYSATEVALENKFGGGVDAVADLIANKPFLFFIQDEGTRQLLFTGRVSDPTVIDGANKRKGRTGLSAVGDLTSSRTNVLSGTMFLFFVAILACFHQLDCHHATEVHRLNFFDTDLLRYAAEDKTGNVMLSPASIKSLLAMVLEGSGGATANEIRSALRLSPNKNDFREQLYHYLNALNVNTSGVLLHNANAVFISNKLTLRKEYELMLRKVYYADVGKVDFTDPIPTSDFINKWVKNHTSGLIDNIVEPAFIKPSTDMMLTNALYFKSSWRYAFDPKWTKGGCFFIEDQCRKVAMMEQHEELNYAYIDNLRAHALELPYEDPNYSMLLLVPYERDGWVSLIRDLPYMSIPQITRLMEPADVRLYLPRFTIDYAESMIEPLQKMRITTLFTRNANLSGMYEAGIPQLNNIIHKVHMIVDEVGTVAAAASSAVVIPLIEDGVQIRVDRPFLFFIKDNKRGLVLFEGKIGEPTAFTEKDVLEPPPKTPPPSPAKRRYSWSYKR